jgi:bacterioferritin-associated ferredoxin
MGMEEFDSADLRSRLKSRQKWGRFRKAAGQPAIPVTEMSAENAAVRIGVGKDCAACGNILMAWLRASCPRQMLSVSDWHDPCAARQG